MNRINNKIPFYKSFHTLFAFNNICKLNLYDEDIYDIIDNYENHPCANSLYSISQELKNIESSFNDDYSFSSNSLYNKVLRIDKEKKTLAFDYTKTLRKECELIVQREYSFHENILDLMIPAENFERNFDKLQCRMIYPALIICYMELIIKGTKYKKLIYQSWGDFINNFLFLEPVYETLKIVKEYLQKEQTSNEHKRNQQINNYSGGNTIEGRSIEVITPKAITENSSANNTCYVEETTKNYYSTQNANDETLDLDDFDKLLQKSNSEMLEKALRG
ncbi:hypothetical protein AAEX28_08015 [Lentisphaerota bacterium WC36G]|nr:hypothetical protein LJT99_10870 [Lentisphaerae bacterium WC36]